jgi:hypothetical protein
MALGGTRSVGRTLVLALTVVLALLNVGHAAAAQLTASWNDNSDGTAGTKLERRLGNGNDFSVIANVPPGVSAHTDTTVSPGTTYCYRAQATTGAAVSPYTPEACATSGLEGSQLGVSVKKAGTGAGTVVSGPAGINCGSTCVATYPAGAVVTLTASASSGSTFTGWSGACAGTGSCTVTGNTSVTVGATFTAASAVAPTHTISLGLIGDPTAGPYAVEAKTSSTSGVAVKFYVDGAFVRRENTARFCLFGGGASGTPCVTGRLGAGSHVVKAQMINASTGAVLAETQGTVSETTSSTMLSLVLSGDPKLGPFSLEAKTAETGVYVKFYVDGALFQTEKNPRFCLFGGGTDGTACVTGRLTAGTHFIRARLVRSSTGAVIAEAQTTVSR